MQLNHSIRNAKYEVGNHVRPKVVPLTLAISSALAAGPALADTVTVTSLSGAASDSDTCTLRGAIITINSGSAVGTCSVPGSNPTIEFWSQLSGEIDLDDAGQGELVVEESMTVDGDDRITITASGQSRHFNVEPGVSRFTLRNIELIDGDASTGGAISSAADELEIIESVLSGNTAVISGGAVYHVPPSGGAMRIRDSVFSNNEATAAGGGAVFSDIDSGQVQIEDNTFSNNQAKYGGGLALETTDSQLFFVKYNEFFDNVATGDEDSVGGGAMIVADNANQPEIKYNEFVGNSAISDGGGLALSVSDSEVSFGENSFNFNESTEGTGGGLYAELTNSQLYGGELVFGFNEAVAGGGGAQITANNSTVGIQEGLFKYNQAADQDSGGFGGGLRISGAFDELGLSYTAFFGNQARGGAGLSISASNSDGDVLIEHSEFSNNTAGIGGVGNGGAIFADLDDNAQMSVTNSTLSGNIGAFEGGGIRQVGGFTLQAKYSTIVDNEATEAGGGISASESGTCLVRNTILANEADGVLQDISGGDCGVSSSLIAGAKYSDYTDGGGNIVDVAPELEPLANNGGLTQTHRPEEGSPVIDAGSTLSNVPEFDQRGTGFDRVSGDAIDMGAYEVQVLEDELFQDRFEEQ